MRHQPRFRMRRFILQIGAVFLLSLTQLGCPPGRIDLIANPTADPITMTIFWGSAVVQQNPDAEPICPRAAFWTIPITQIVDRRIPRNIDALQAVAVSLDELECAATVEIQPGMAVSTGDPRGFGTPMSLSDRISIRKRDINRLYERQEFDFKMEFSYGSPRISVWRL